MLKSSINDKEKNNFGILFHSQFNNGEPENHDPEKSRFTILGLRTFFFALENVSKNNIIFRMFEKKRQLRS